MKSVFQTVIQKLDMKGAEAFIDEWFLMSSPVPVLLIAVSYLLFVLKIGPRLMKDRKPFMLNNLLLVYNFAQVIASTGLLCYGVWLLLPQGLVFRNCQLGKTETLAIGTGIYYYFNAKISELLDTVFFVLRKKNNQITFLHVYHHTLMMMSTWLTLKYEPTYSTVFLGTLNSFVHIIMYAYYGLSTFPSISKYLWWKKYITTMQLVQFGMIILQAIMNTKYSGCPPSTVLLATITLNACLFIYLFGDFYVKAYMKNKQTAESLIKDSPRRLSKYADDLKHMKLAEKVL